MIIAFLLSLRDDPRLLEEIFLNHSSMNTSVFAVINLRSRELDYVKKYEFSSIQGFCYRELERGSERLSKFEMFGT